MLVSFISQMYELKKTLNILDGTFAYLVSLFTGLFDINYIVFVVEFVLESWGMQFCINHVNYTSLNESIELCPFLHKISKGQVWSLALFKEIQEHDMCILIISCCLLSGPSTYAQYRCCIICLKKLFHIYIYYIV